MAAAANATKELTVWEIILVFGSSYSSYSVVAAVADLLAWALAVAVTTAAYGLLSYYSSVAVLAATTVAVAADATTAASSLTYSFCSNGRSFTYIHIN